MENSIVNITMLSEHPIEGFVLFGMEYQNLTLQNTQIVVQNSSKFVQFSGLCSKAAFVDVQNSLFRFTIDYADQAFAVGDSINNVHLKNVKFDFVLSGVGAASLVHQIYQQMRIDSSLV